MSKSRAKKLRKRARKEAASNGSGESTVTEAAPDLEELWCAKGSDAWSQNCKALKLELLGPFLFGQSTLSQPCVELWQREGVLEGGASALSVFFAREQWDTIRTIVAVVLSVLELMETNDHFRDCLLKSTSSAAKEDKVHVMRLIQSERVHGILPSKIRSMFGAIKCHVREFAGRAQNSSDGLVSSQTMVDKEKLIAPVKDRGNTNFKQDRYKAAIGDYTTAIKLCPYNPILYCNRSLCYLRNEEYWCACLDSYRAIVLRPGWEKAYYRCSESWAKLGEPEMAMVINKEGIKECREVEDLSKQSADLRSGSPNKDDVKKTVSSDGPAKKSPPNEAPKKPTATAEPARRPDPIPSKSEEGSKVTIKKPPAKKAPPFTDFETLMCPTISSQQLSCSSLKSISRSRDHKYFNPTAYFFRSHDWEQLETLPKAPAKLHTNIDTIKEPMQADFDEIWCPLVAESADKLRVKPPQFHYLSEADVLKHKLRPPS